MVKKKVWPEFLRQYYFKLYSRRHSLCLQKRELIFVYIFQFYHRGGFNYCVRNKKSTLLLYKLYQGTSAWSPSSPPGLSILLRCVWWTQAVNLWVTSGHVWSLNVAAGQCLHWERTVSRTVLFIPELLLNTLKKISFFFLVLLSLPWTQSQTFLLCIFSEPVLCNSSWHTPALLIIFGVVKCAVVNVPKLTVCPNRFLQPMR